MRKTKKELAEEIFGMLINVEETWRTGAKTAKALFDANQTCYDKAMKLCKENGYVGKGADGVWDLAVTLHARHFQLAKYSY